MAAPVVDVQRGTDSGGSPAGTSLTTPAMTTGGTNRVLVAFIAFNKESGAVPTVSSVTDTSGLTWTKLDAVTLATYTITNPIIARGEIWWAQAPLLLSSVTVTANFSSAPTAAVLDVVAFSGCYALSTPFDSNASNPTHASDVSGSSTLPTATISTSQADDLIIGWGFCGRNSQSNATGWTNLAIHSPSPDFPASFFTIIETKSFAATQSGLAVSPNTNTTDWGMYALALTGDAPPAPITKSYGQVIC
jgi:hypothetical protein